MLMDNWFSEMIFFCAKCLIEIFLFVQNLFFIELIYFFHGLIRPFLTEFSKMVIASLFGLLLSAGCTCSGRSALGYRFDAFLLNVTWQKVNILTYLLDVLVNLWSQNPKICLHEPFVTAEHHER